jgi:Saxitoxin biosynthesis operon protein SxtJ
MPSNSHENLSRRSVEIGSNRSFGVVMGVACLVLSWLWFWAGSAYWPIWAGAAAVFGSLALLWPRLLSPLNRVWFWFGLALHKVVNPVVMGVLFFGVIMPVGVLMRLTGKRLIEFEFEPDSSSYWMRRGSALQPGSMTKQY